MDTQKMSVSQIKDYITKNYDIPIEQINNIKGKSNLLNLISSLDNDLVPNLNDIDFKIPENSTEIPEVTTEIIPDINSAEWSDYVLSQLSEDEKDQGYPKADGLRRLVEKYIGRIILINSKVVQAPSSNNAYIATVKTTINVLLHNGQIITFSACADAVKEFCPKPYNQHLSAIAETRAEGRVYRKLLRLKNTATREEMMSQDMHSDLELITPNQKNIIDILCRNDRLNINVQKLFSQHFKDNKPISKYTFNQASEIGTILSEYQSDLNSIPQEIRGYDAAWRST